MICILINKAIFIYRELAVHVDGFIAAVAHTTVVGASQVSLMTKVLSCVSLSLSRIIK